MIELIDCGWILAAAEQATQNPSTLQTWGPWGAVIIALGGKDGIVYIVSRLFRNGNGNGKYNKELCKRLHAEIDEDRKNGREDMKYMRRQIGRISAHLHISDDD